ADRDELQRTLAMAFANAMLSEVTYAYDAQGRRIERISRFGTLSEERTTFSYDDRGNAIEETTESHDREINHDEQGALRTTEHAPRRHEIRFEYDYDTQDNWTARVVWSRIDASADFQRSNVERRVVEYYER